MPPSSESGAMIRIYGDGNSGNCLKVKWVCDALALPTTWIDVDTTTGGSRTVEFLKLNPWGQVPTVEFDDGRTLAQSNAIIRYLARGSDLIPADPFAAAQMDAWLFWSNTAMSPMWPCAAFRWSISASPPASSTRILVKRGYAALDSMERRLSEARFLVGDVFSLADVALLAYTRVAHEGGFDLTSYASLRRWIAEAEKRLGLPAAR